MPDNLYTDTSAGAVTVSSNNSNFLGFNTNWINLPNFSFVDTINFLNYFSLSWMITHSILMIANFFIYYFKFGALDDQLEFQNEAIDSLKNSWQMWKNYTFCLLAYLVYLNFENTAIWGIVLGLLATIAYIWQIIKNFTLSPVVNMFKGEDNSIVGQGFQKIREFTTKSKKSGKGGIVTLFLDIFISLWDLLMRIVAGIFGFFSKGSTAPAKEAPKKSAH